MASLSPDNVTFGCSMPPGSPSSIKQPETRQAANSQNTQSQGQQRVHQVAFCTEILA